MRCIGKGCLTFIIECVVIFTSMKLMPNVSVLVLDHLCLEENSIVWAFFNVPWIDWSYLIFSCV